VTGFYECGNAHPCSVQAGDLLSSQEGLFSVQSVQRQSKVRRRVKTIGDEGGERQTMREKMALHCCEGSFW
jgi:hypothetical protein